MKNHSLFERVAFMVSRNPGVLGGGILGVGAGKWFWWKWVAGD